MKAKKGFEHRPGWGKDQGETDLLEASLDLKMEIEV
jgi:hypothetical protein